MVLAAVASAGRRRRSRVCAERCFCPTSISANTLSSSPPEKPASHPSEWYSAFARRKPPYAVLHLNDWRCLYGWPKEWPGRSDQGHFRSAEPTWLDEKNKPMESNVVDMLIPADQVRMVEFLPEHQTDKGE